MRARRTAATLAVVASLAVGHQVTSRLDLAPEGDDPPFLTAATVGEEAELTYANVEVTDVRPARIVAPRVTTDLVRRATGVFVLVSVKVVSTREPTVFRAVYLVDEAGRQHRTSARASCASVVTSPTGVPGYALFCFDVAPDLLAGLRLQLGRGSLVYSTTQGDALADVDLGISEADERTWSQTEAAYAAESDGRQPFELEPVTVEEAS